MALGRTPATISKTIKFNFFLELHFSNLLRSATPKFNVYLLLPSVSLRIESYKKIPFLNKFESVLKYCQELFSNKHDKKMAHEYKIYFYMRRLHDEIS